MCQHCPDWKQACGVRRSAAGAQCAEQEGFVYHQVREQRKASAALLPVSQPQFLVAAAALSVAAVQVVCKLQAEPQRNRCRRQH